MKPQELKNLQEQLKELIKKAGEVQEIIENHPDDFNYEIFDDARCAVDHLIGVGMGIGLEL
jgi:hypothetical protein